MELFKQRLAFVWRNVWQLLLILTAIAIFTVVMVFIRDHGPQWLITVLTWFTIGTGILLIGGIVLLMIAAFSYEIYKGIRWLFIDPFKKEKG